MSKSSSQSSGTGFAGLLTVLFIGLKTDQLHHLVVVVGAVAPVDLGPDRPGRPGRPRPDLRYRPRQEPAGLTMDKNHPISITQVANGFEVRPMTALGSAISLDSIHVFNSLADLLLWMEAHFSHRCPVVHADQLPPMLTEAQS